MAPPPLYRDVETFARAGQRTLAQANHARIKVRLDVDRENRLDIVDATLLNHAPGTGRGLFRRLKHRAEIVLETQTAKPHAILMDHQRGGEGNGAMRIVPARMTE